MAANNKKTQKEGGGKIRDIAESYSHGPELRTMNFKLKTPYLQANSINFQHFFKYSNKYAQTHLHKGGKFMVRNLGPHL